MGHRWENDPDNPRRSAQCEWSVRAHRRLHGSPISAAFSCPEKKVHRLERGGKKVYLYTLDVMSTFATADGAYADHYDPGRFHEPTREMRALIDALDANVHMRGKAHVRTTLYAAHPLDFRTKSALDGLRETVKAATDVDVFGAPERTYIVLSVAVGHKHAGFLENAAAAIARDATLTPLVVDEPGGRSYRCASSMIVDDRTSIQREAGTFGKPGFDALLQGMRVVLDEPSMTPLDLATYCPTDHVLRTQYNGDFVEWRTREKDDGPDDAIDGFAESYAMGESSKRRTYWGYLQIRLYAEDVAANTQAVVDSLMALASNLPKRKGPKPDLGTGPLVFRAEDS